MVCLSCRMCFRSVSGFDRTVGDFWSGFPPTFHRAAPPLGVFLQCSTMRRPLPLGVPCPRFGGFVGVGFRTCLYPVSAPAHVLGDSLVWDLGRVCTQYQPPIIRERRRQGNPSALRAFRVSKGVGVGRWSYSDLLSSVLAQIVRGTARCVSNTFRILAWRPFSEGRSLAPGPLARFL